MEKGRLNYLFNIITRIFLFHWSTCYPSFSYVTKFPCPWILVSRDNFLYFKVFTKSLKRITTWRTITITKRFFLEVFGFNELHMKRLKGFEYFLKKTQEIWLWILIANNWRTRYEYGKNTSPGLGELFSVFVSVLEFVILKRL